MAVSIRTQVISLLLASALGLGLGLCYDLLRPVRHRSGDLVLDLLFCIFAASSAFLFAMQSADGTLGTGELLLALLGLLIYFQFFSPLFLPVFGKLDRIIGGFWINTQKHLKKVSHTAKKLFQKTEE